jgi:hypothetical protein
MSLIPARALRQALEYLHNDELEHYLDCCLAKDGSDRLHVYKDVLTLLRWVHRTYAPGEMKEWAGDCICEYETKVQDLDLKNAA